MIPSVIARRAALAVVLALGGCRPEPQPDIEGEWGLALTVVQPGHGAQAHPGQRLDATLVIDPRIPDTYESLSELPDSSGFTPARIYWRPYRLETGITADIFEEAYARVDSAGSFDAWLTPGVTHVGILLEGRLSGDSITGRWTQDEYSGQPGSSGTFRMRRGRRTAMTDSALQRSRRGQLEWERNSR